VHGLRRVRIVRCARGELVSPLLSPAQAHADHRLFLRRYDSDVLRRA
jgi:hypothetical protein